MAGGFELRPERAEVVDFAVEDDPDGPIFVVDRLMSRRQIDDAQPPHAERNPLVHEPAFVVGAAMPDDLAHPADQFLARFQAAWRARVCRFHEAGDSAHALESSF